MSTIPASQLVNVVPSVIGAGGNAVDVVGLILTSSVRPPIGTVPSFADAASVSSYFGANSQEASLAAIYFAGFDGASALPASLLFAQYNSDAVAAYVRGGNVSSLTVPELQAISGSLNITVDGYPRNDSSLNLSAATSFSSAASIIQTGLNANNPTVITLTGAISGTTLTASGVSGGSLAIGQTVVGSGVTAGTIITALGSGTGGSGTYTVNNSQTVGSESMTTTGTPVVVTYDSTSGAFIVTSGITGAPSTMAFATGTIAASLGLTSATGAVLSQGAAAAVPASFMDGVIAVTQDFVLYMTAFDPDNSGNTLKQAFAAWNTLQDSKFVYVCWDTDVTPTVSDPATGSLGYILAQNNDSGTCLLNGDAAAGWDDTTGANLAAFVMGTAASINFQQTNGRITFAYKSGGSLPATVTTSAVAVALGGNPQSLTDRGNGYNFYGAYGAAASSFVDFQRGFITGAFKWLDTYVNQVWLNSSLQIALLTFLRSANSVPFNQAGYSQIESALADPIASALAFGAFAPGALSQSQIANVNASAGKDISVALQTQGYYLLITAANTTVRGARGPLQITFFYLDRGSVQSINLSSVAVI